MYRFVWKLFFFLLISVILYFISYIPFTNSILPNPSFYYLSTLVDKFDKKIQNITLTSLEPRIVTSQINKFINNLDSGKSLSHSNNKSNLNTNADSNTDSGSDDQKSNELGRQQHNSHNGHKHTDKQQSSVEDDPNAQPFVVNTYFLYLLRIFSRFLFLIFVQLYVFYILLFRYGELFKDLCDLSIKSMKDFNWNSPVNFMKSFYCFMAWLLSIFMYYNAQLSVRHKLIVYSLLVLVVSLVLFRVGIGTKNLINTSSLFIGLTVYLTVLFTFKSKIPDLLVLIDNWFVYVWSLSILVRGFRFEVVDNVTCLTVRSGLYDGSIGAGFDASPSQASDRSGSDANAMSSNNTGSQSGHWNSILGYNMVKLTHEASCALDLHLILLMLNLVKSIPFFGKLFLSNVYLSHASLLFNLSMLMHCFMVYASPASSLSFRRLSSGSLNQLQGLDSTPLSKIRQFVLFVLNYFVLYLFGVPNYFSSKAGSYNLFLNHFSKFKNLFKVLFGRFLEPLYQRPSFLFLLKCIESIPQLFFLLLPPFFSRLYFEYSTLLMPITTFLSHNTNLKEKAFCLILFALANLVRNLCNLMYWFSFKSFMRIILIFTLNYVMVLFKRLIKLSE